MPSKARELRSLGKQVGNARIALSGALAPALSSIEHLANLFREEVEHSNVYFDRTCRMTITSHAVLESLYDFGIQRAAILGSDIRQSILEIDWKSHFHLGIFTRHG